jgi:hypothetical protein
MIIEIQWRCEQVRLERQPLAVFLFPFATALVSAMGTNATNKINSINFSIIAQYTTISFRHADILLIDLFNVA